MLIKRNDDRFADSVTVGDTMSGKTSLKSISPRSRKEIKNSSMRKSKLLGGDLAGGRTTLHTIPNESAAGLPNSARQAAIDSNIAQTSKNANLTEEMPSKKTPVESLKSGEYTKIDAGAGVITPAAASNYNIPRSAEKVSAKLLIYSNIG